MVAVLNPKALIWREGGSRTQNPFSFSDIQRGLRVWVAGLALRGVPDWLATSEGNRRGIRDFSDLARTDVRIANRERGSGARQVLDEALASAGLSPQQVAGYDGEVAGHLSVAAAIHNGAADTGVTIRVAAEAYGLDFIPIREERYDLAIPHTEMESVPVRRMLDALNSRRFAREVSQLCGYDTGRMGEELARIDC